MLTAGETLRFKAASKLLEVEISPSMQPRTTHQPLETPKSRGIRRMARDGFIEISEKRLNESKANKSQQEQ